MTGSGYCARPSNTCKASSACSRRISIDPGCVGDPEPTDPVGAVRTMALRRRFACSDLGRVPLQSSRVWRWDVALWLNPACRRRVDGRPLRAKFRPSGPHRAYRPPVGRLCPRSLPLPPKSPQSSPSGLFVWNQVSPAGRRRRGLIAAPLPTRIQNVRRHRRHRSPSIELPLIYSSHFSYNPRACRHR